MASFKRGDRVVYVGTPFSLKRWFQELWHPTVGDMLVKNSVYVVANITPGDSVEIIGVWSPADDYWDAGFVPWAFRPAVERKADISCFTAILTDAKPKVDA